MKAKFILLRKKAAQREFFAIRLSDYEKRSYRAIRPPFDASKWNYETQALIVPKGYQRQGNKKKPGPDRSAEYREYEANQQWIDETEKRYNTQITGLVRLNKPFSFSKIFDLVDNPNKEARTLFSVFEDRILELKQATKYATAASYHSTLNKVKGYSKNDMLINEVDAAFLIGFRESMKDLSNATRALHLRGIRSIWRYAVRKKYAQLNDYPFINPEIWKDTAVGRRSRAIGREQIEAIRQLKTELEEGSRLWHACNYFLFGYLGLGINFVDIARLKWDDRVNDRITFIRWKTRAKIQEQTSFKITPELDSIIKWYRFHGVQIGNPYIFPVLSGFHDTEKRKFDRIKKVRGQVNDDLKEIGRKINSPVPLTTYVWRHTFASVAKNDLQVDIAMISEMLGHHDLETTKFYLKNFPDNAKDAAVAGL